MKITPNVLRLLKMRTRKEDRWAVYENPARRGYFGSLAYLRIGPGRRYKVTPELLPDPNLELGGKFFLIGWVDLDSGSVLFK